MTNTQKAQQKKNPKPLWELVTHYHIVLLNLCHILLPHVTAKAEQPEKISARFFKS